MNILGTNVKEQVLIDNLLNARNNEEMLQKLTTLQNEIGVFANTRITAITSIKNDLLAGAFAKAFADAYNCNGSSTLIIDANLYNPSLEEVLGLKDNFCSDLAFQDSALNGTVRLTKINEKSTIICMDKQIYPSDVYKNKVVHKLIKENVNSYDHIIVLVPSIKKHKEISLLKDSLESILMVVQRSVTKKEDVYNALCFFEDAKLPISKTIILK